MQIMNKKDTIMRKTLIEQATKNISDPDALKFYIDKIENMTDVGLLNIALGKMSKDLKHIGRIFKAQEPLFNLVTSILQVMEEDSPSLFKKSVEDLSDGIKFTIGGRNTLNESDPIHKVLKCIFNDAFYSMMRDARTSVDDLEGGIETVNMLTNMSDEEYEEMAKKFEDKEYPDDVSKEIEKASKEIKNAKKGGHNAEA
jgi:hypothetical protein